VLLHAKAGFCESVTDLFNSEVEAEKAEAHQLAAFRQKVLREIGGLSI
jgi:hypothetical protein